LPTLKNDTPQLFAIMTEIGIIDQLATNLFAARLPSPMTMPQFSVLNHLIRLGNGQTPKQIARAFQVPNTSMSHTVALLAKNKFVELRQNDQDRRSKTLWVTPLGHTAHTAALSTVADDISVLHKEFEDKDVQDLLGLLTRLRSLLDAKRIT